MHCVLTDFGLMKDVNANNAPLTVVGSFLGDVRLRRAGATDGRDDRARVDVYALGCMLYQAVTDGAVPAPGIGGDDAAHVDEAPPIVTARPRRTRRRRSTASCLTAMAQGPRRALPIGGRPGPRRARATR